MQYYCKLHVVFRYFVLIIRTIKLFKHHTLKLEHNNNMIWFKCVALLLSSYEDPYLYVRTYERT